MRKQLQNFYDKFETNVTSKSNEVFAHNKFQTRVVELKCHLDFVCPAIPKVLQYFLPQVL